MAGRGKDSNPAKSKKPLQPNKAERQNQLTPPMMMVAHRFTGGPPSSSMPFMSGSEHEQSENKDQNARDKTPTKANRLPRRSRDRPRQRIPIALIQNERSDRPAQGKEYIKHFCPLPPAPRHGRPYTHPYSTVNSPDARAFGTFLPIEAFRGKIKKASFEPAGPITT